MQIDTHQIECFLSVAKHLNFTMAANELFISQPAISRKVATLEKELNIILIDRTNRELKLTEEGEVFQKYFKDFMIQMEALTSTSKKLDPVQYKEIKLGIFEGWNLSSFLRQMKADFKITHEHVIFSIDTSSEKNLILGLREGKYDVIILLKISIKCAIGKGIISNVNSFDFDKVHKAVLYSAYNSLSQKESLSFKDFNGQTLYTFKSDIVPNDIIMNKEILSKYELTSNVKILSSLEAMVNEISTGNGYALLDMQMRILDNHEFNYIELEEQHAISIATIKNRKNDIIEDVLKYCQNINLLDFKNH